MEAPGPCTCTLGMYLLNNRNTLIFREYPGRSVGKISGRGDGGTLGRQNGIVS